MSSLRYHLAACSAVALLMAGTAHAEGTCHHLGYDLVPHMKPNKLYVYFPTANDATYPEFGVSGLVTSPAHKFDAAELPSYAALAGATTAALRDAVFDVVTDDYCEFNVEVIETLTAPTNAEARRNTVAVGTDAQVTSTSRTWGLAQNVDTGHATIVDFARVWAGTYNTSNGALTGANSTLDRWAKSIGGTTAHEGGHNYGLSHSDGLVLRPGEDVLTHHVMAAGSNYSDEQRASYRRHFSDNEYSILAANVGLSVQTMYNWDFVNPNAQTATKLRMTFLSTQSSLAILWTYLGSQSPWSTPTVSGVLGTQAYKGVNYNRFQVTWSVPQAWQGGIGSNAPGGVAGQVGGGAEFHVGTSFTTVNYNTPDPIIITQVDLLDSGNAVLALHPRVAAFDSGVLDSADGSFAINAINLQGVPLQLSNIRVQMLPRLVSINSLVSNAERATDIFGVPVAPWRDSKVSVREARFVPKVDVPITIAKLTDPRQVVQVVDERACDRGDRTSGPDTAACRRGTTVSLFPSTAVLLTATATEPAAKHWDPKRKAYVVGPLQTRTFMQIAGRHPDLNGNKVDDYIDISTQKAPDRNRDGVIDTAQRGKTNR